ncbi:hypothetical protein PINS_up001408 [Pythium insidiosum]|nr:hypothetical protein PINS_up001408 [Pythium insidiosum]
MTKQASLAGDARHTSQIQREIEALLKLYVATGGERGAWKVVTGWPSLAAAVQQTADQLALRGTLASQLPLHGVTWENNHVVVIDLSDNGLRGKLPRQLSHLKYLKQLKLRNNPELRGPVPSALYEMSHLRYCYLDGTHVENVLPPNAAHSFQITKLYSDTDRAASIHFLTDSRGRGVTRWFADMTESELFTVHMTLKAQHEKPSEATVEIQRTAQNATGPERVAAAIKLQRIYRARIERTKFRRFLSSLFEKHVDASSGHQYFIDKRTGEAMWERPAFVKATPRKTDPSHDHGGGGGDEDIWQAFDDGYGNTVCEIPHRRRLEAGY